MSAEDMYAIHRNISEPIKNLIIPPNPKTFFLESLKKETDGKASYEAFSFVIVPRKPWAPKRESPIVSLDGAHGSL